MLSKEEKKLFEKVIKEMDYWSEKCDFDEITFSVQMLSIFMSHRIVVTAFNLNTNTHTHFVVDKKDIDYINNLFEEAVRQVKE